MIFMIMALLILALVIVWIFDVHTVLHLKARTQNAGDASALAAARWQGVTLNLIGDLNIMQALALSVGDSNAGKAISEAQARLCYVGPMIALMASQQAAKNNGIYIYQPFSEYMQKHASQVKSDYPIIFTNEPYTDCWQEYGQMLADLAAGGICSGPDNARLYTDYSYGHTLFMQDFYDAVAARNWCWFHFNDMTLLTTYLNYQSWPGLPPPVLPPRPVNSEYFGLGLDYINAALPGGINTIHRMNALQNERNLGITAISNEVAGATVRWYVYKWQDWMSNLPKDFPFRGVPNPSFFKPQYDYYGADAAVRIEALSQRLTPGAKNALITWTAAAKPFGFLTDDTGNALRPDACTVILPAFRSVRLIPVDASTAPIAGSYNLDWRRHIEDHLQIYLDSGQTDPEGDCWYCQQLQTWEDPAFRQQGIDWLSNTNNHCYRPVGGSGTSGGARRGH